MLATVGVPIWATEVDVSAQDENDRADFIELAVRALYGHPAVEGILFWGIYADTRSDHKALFYGDDLQVYRWTLEVQCGVWQLYSKPSFRAHVHIGCPSIYRFTPSYSSLFSVYPGFREY